MRINNILFREEADGTWSEIRLPTKKEVCPRCDGEGKHVNEAIDGNGLSAEDFDEAGPEFREDYMSGVYDVTCRTCNGLRVIDAVDFDRMSAADRAAFEKQERESDECDAIHAAEIRAGA